MTEMTRAMFEPVTRGAFFLWIREAVESGAGDGVTPLRGAHARRARDLCEALWPGWPVDKVVAGKASLYAIGRDGDRRLIKQREASNAAHEGRVRWVNLHEPLSPDEEEADAKYLLPEERLTRNAQAHRYVDLIQRRVKIRRAHLDEELQARCTEADEALIEALTIARRLAREGVDPQAMRLYALLKDAAWSVGEIEDLMLGDVVRSGEDLAG